MEARPGRLVIRVWGPGAAEVFARERGGHRFQRVPPNEKRGRVHTSTITVAVLREPTAHEVVLDPRDLSEQFTRGSGNGGQHRQKNDTCAVVTHLPTGLTVRVDGGRSQHLNRRTAHALLRARLQAAADAEGDADRNRARARQVGSGMRGDKRRTIAMQRDRVVDHVTGTSMPLRRYLEGHLRELWA